MSADDQPRMCLLHRDFHVMASECWRMTVDFYAKHQDMSEAEHRNAYQAAVERGMLDDLRRR